MGVRVEGSALTLVFPTSFDRRASPQKAQKPFTVLNNSSFQSMTVSHRSKDLTINDWLLMSVLFRKINEPHQSRRPRRPDGALASHARVSERAPSGADLKRVILGAKLVERICTGRCKYLSVAGKEYQHRVWLQFLPDSPSKASDN